MQRWMNHAAFPDMEPVTKMSLSEENSDAKPDKANEGAT